MIQRVKVKKQRIKNQKVKQEKQTKKKGETKMKKTINLVVSLALVLSSPAVFAMPDMSSAGDSVRLHHQKQETPQPSQNQFKKGLVKKGLGSNSIYWLGHRWDHVS